MLYNRKFGVAIMAGCCAVAIFAPDLESTSYSRFLMATDGNLPYRGLQGSDDKEVPAPPSDATFSCAAGQEPFRIDWTNVDIVDNEPLQTVTFENGYKITMSVVDTAPGKATKWGKDDDGNLYFTAGTVLDKSQLIDPSGGPQSGLEYPAGYSTLQLQFNRELEGLYISISDVDSNTKTSDAVRIRMYDEQKNEVKTQISNTGSIEVTGNMGFESVANQRAVNPGYDASLYAKAMGPVQTIALDQSVFFYKDQLIGKFSQRTIYPALDFAYCAPIVAPTPAPIKVEDTPAPVVVKETPRPTALAGGVNGDPLIMGLSGQLFKFEGRSGAWYSAVSTPSFQWNMKIQKYDTCPAHSNNFITGTGFTFFDLKGNKEREIEVNVANPYTVNVGCGNSENNCLGAGSLEIVLDGVKIVTGGDYHFQDGTGRILAFNTFHECSRKWYDFDVHSSGAAVEERRLRTIKPDAFHIIEHLKNTMIDQHQCETWLHQRKKNGDLFDQPGRYTTIVIMTEQITLHIEYKQEQERCSAHSIDVWISSVSPDLLDEKWDGVIGETKDPSYVLQGETTTMDRVSALKHATDEAYEVNAPFSNKCKGCAYQEE